MSQQFVIVSLKHTQKQHRYVTFWRPNRAGYAWPLSWAGKYDEADARDIDDSPDSDSIAVPYAVAIGLSEAPDPGFIDCDAGPIVRRSMLRKLKAARLARPMGAAA